MYQNNLYGRNNNYAQPNQNQFYDLNQQPPTSYGGDFMKSNQQAQQSQASYLQRLSSPTNLYGQQDQNMSGYGMQPSYQPNVGSPTFGQYHNAKSLGGPSGMTNISFQRQNSRVNTYQNSSFQRNYDPYQNEVRSPLQKNRYQNEFDFDNDLSSNYQNSINQSSQYQGSTYQHSNFNSSMGQNSQYQPSHLSSYLNKPQPTRQSPQKEEDEPKKKLPRVSTTTNEEGEKLYECSKGCGRRFLAKALDIHESVCLKVFQNKRNEFNSKKMRQVDENQEKLVRISDVSKRQSKNSMNKQQRKDWKQHSQAFRAFMKASQGQELNYQEKDALKSFNELITCEYCGQRLDQFQAIKHIPQCRENTYQNIF